MFRYIIFSLHASISLTSESPGNEGTGRDLEGISGDKGTLGGIKTLQETAIRYGKGEI